MILQFCRCGGLFDVKGHPDGFLSRFSSLRNFRLCRFFDSLGFSCPRKREQENRFEQDSALTLIVGDALSLRGSGLFGREGQNDEGDEVGQHVVNNAGHVELEQEVKAGVDIAQSAEEAEQDRSQCDLHRTPAAEDHDGEGQEAEARDAVFKLPDTDAGRDESDAAEAAEHAGDHDTGITHLVDVDADGVRRLRMLAAGTQAQAEARLIQHSERDDQCNDGNQHEPVELEFADVQDEELLRLDVGDIGGNVVATGHRRVHSLDRDSRSSRCQQVHGRAGDGLVRAERDRGNGEQQRIQQARRSAGEDDRQDHDRCADGDRQEFHDKCAAECADDHDALKADVDDAGTLREAAAQAFGIYLRNGLYH